LQISKDKIEIKVAQINEIGLSNWTEKPIGEHQNPHTKRPAFTDNPEIKEKSSHQRCNRENQSLTDCFLVEARLYYH